MSSRMKMAFPKGEKLPKNVFSDFNGTDTKGLARDLSQSVIDFESKRTASMLSLRKHLCVKKLFFVVKRTHRSASLRSVSLLRFRTFLFAPLAAF
jgi:hypothetical protein